MNSIPLWVQIVIALLGSSIFGAIAGVISSSLAARQKFRELEIAYRQKLNDNFLHITQQSVDSLYIPLNKSLSNLYNKYKEFAFLKMLFDNGVRPVEKNDKGLAETVKEKEKAYRDACLEHKKLVDQLGHEGKDLFLPMEFEEKLHDFAEFLNLTAMTYFEGKELERHPEMRIMEIGSQEFEKAFHARLRVLKSHIKEITLGTTEMIKN